MGIAAEPVPASGRMDGSDGIDVGWVVERLAAVPQFFLALLPRTCHRALTWLLGRRADDARGGTVLALSLAGFALGLVGFVVLFHAVLGLLAVWAHTFP